MIYGYKLYDRSSEMFYRGRGRWGKIGKVWARLGDLTLALKVSALISSNMLRRAACLEVIELVEGDRIPFMAVYDPKMNRKEMPR